MFKIEKRTFIYFIIYINNTEKYTQDYEIVKLLKSVISDIALRKYQNILKKYNAIRLHNNESFFRDEEDAKKCCNYLNEKYGIVLKLLE